MAGLWVITVLLVFFPSVASRAAVDQNHLAELIQAVVEQYDIEGMFSLALSIQSEDPSNTKQLFIDNPKDEVTKALSLGEVYRGNRLAVAKVQKPEHAELRVLKDLHLDSNAGELLVIYSYASSCSTTCTNFDNKHNIIKEIDNVVNQGQWSSHVFVFEVVFKPKGKRVKKTILIKALEDLGKSKITLPNIFRCYKLDNRFQCTSCSSGGKVTDACVDYDAKKSAAGRSPETQE